MSYDATPPPSRLNFKVNFFPLSYDLLEGKKSTPVRTGALVRKLATGRAGVEFLIDAGDVGACLSDGANLEPLLVKSVLTTSETLTGWGGSGREGKVLVKCCVQCHEQFPRPDPSRCCRLARSQRRACP